MSGTIYLGLYNRGKKIAIIGVKNRLEESWSRTVFKNRLQESSSKNRGKEPLVVWGSAASENQRAKSWEKTKSASRLASPPNQYLPGSGSREFQPITLGARALSRQDFTTTN